MTDLTLNRRTMLAGAAALPAMGAALAAAPALADGHAAPNAIKHSFKLGDMEVAAILAGQAGPDNHVSFVFKVHLEVKRNDGLVFCQQNVHHFLHIVITVARMNCSIADYRGEKRLIR